MLLDGKRRRRRRLCWERRVFWLPPISSSSSSWVRSGLPPKFPPPRVTTPGEGTRERFAKGLGVKNPPTAQRANVGRRDLVPHLRPFFLPPPFKESPLRPSGVYVQERRPCLPPLFLNFPLSPLPCLRHPPPRRLPPSLLF